MEFLTKKNLYANYISEPIAELSSINYKTIPEVSVILITYNHRNYIEKSIESILKQVIDFPIEIIIGDDDSTDGTREICIKYAKKYPEIIRLFLHNRKNNIKILGKPCAVFQYYYNILHSRGKYIAVISGDDEWGDDNKLQMQYSYLESHLDCSLVFQGWKERIYNQDAHAYSYGKINTSFPKASTNMFRNFKDKIPIQALNVIQEDEFGWFILKSDGYFKCMDGLKPTIINVLSTSITNTLNIIDFFNQVFNLNKNIYITYKGAEREVEAKIRMASLTYGVLTNRKYNGVRMKCIYKILKFILSERLLSFTFMYCINKGYRRLVS